MAAQPCLEVAQRDGHVGTDTGRRGRRADASYGEQVGGSDVHVLAGPVELVGPVVEHAVEDLPADGDECRVGDPGAVEAVLGLALLVQADPGEGGRARLRVLGRDLGGHASDGVRAAPVARADQQLGVGAQERRGHGDLGAVGELEVGAVSEGLDDAEQVVPAAGVEAGTVLPERVEDLLHLEGRRDRLDQDGGAHGAARDAEQLLGEAEDVVPEPGLLRVLQLGEVEVRAVAGVDLALRAVEEVEAEVDQRSGDGPAPDLQVLFDQVPAPGADHDGRQVLPEAVLLAVGRGEVDAPLDGVEQAELAADDVVPGGCGGVLEVRHPHAGTGVEGVDGHAPVGRPGDLDTAVGETGGRGRHPPVGVGAHGSRGDGEVQRGSRDEAVPSPAPLLEDLVAPVGEGRVEAADEAERLRGEDLLVAVARCREDPDPVRGGDGGHAVS